MDEQKAEATAEALGGTVWNSGGGIYLVRIERSDGRLVVISDDVICEYESEQAFDENQAVSSILLH